MNAGVLDLGILIFHSKANFVSYAEVGWKKSSWSLRKTLYQMSDQKITVKIIEEKPVGYVIEIIDKQSTMTVPKKTFLRRVERGMYDVTNIAKLMTRL